MLSYSFAEHHIPLAVSRYVSDTQIAMSVDTHLETVEDVLAVPDDVVILVGGPDDPLFDVVRRRDHAAVLMLVERPSAFLTSDEVDDLMFTPFTNFELAVRAARALRRSTKVAAPRVLALEDDGVRFGASHVTLSDTQCRLVAQFMSASGGIVTRRDLLAAIEPGHASAHAIEARIGRLRRRLEALPGVRIETIRQRGYRLVVDAATRSPARPRGRAFPCASDA